MKINLPCHPENLMDDLKELRSEMSNSQLPEMRIAGELMEKHIESVVSVLTTNEIKEE